MSRLGVLRAAIDAEPQGPVHDLLTAAFVSSVRRVSKATTQQGRLFLDVATALEEPWHIFESRYVTATRSVSALPVHWAGKAIVATRSAITPWLHQTQSPSLAPSLCILHPPYFNNYRYSRVNSLELAWLGVAHADVRRDEVREFFKVGGASNVAIYIDDMLSVLQTAYEGVRPHGHIALMIGDSTFRGEYLPVTSMLVTRSLDLGLVVELVALRVPRFTEASWVASQRRTGRNVGIALCDFIIVFRKQ